MIKQEKPRWIKCSESLPISEPYDGENAKYYTVNLGVWGYDNAMFLDGEWYKDYTAKTVVPVISWLEL